MKNVYLRAITPLLLAACAFAGVVRSGDGFATVYSDLPAAIAASSDGEVLIASAGNYTGFTIDGKGLAIYATPGAELVVDGLITIKNVPPGREVFLSGVTIDRTQIQTDLPSTLSVVDCAGSVWFEACTILGAWGYNGYAGQASPGECALELSNATNVVVAHSTLHGGRGGWADWNACCASAASGGDGMRLTASRVAVYDSVITGGQSGAGGVTPMVAAAGCNLDSTSTVFISGSSLVGGLGGAYAFGSGSAITAGGPGISVQSLGVAFSLDSTFTGGLDGNFNQQAPPIEGSLNQLAGTARHLSIPSIVGDSSPDSVTLQGEANDALRLAFALFPSWHLQVPANGVWSVAYPAKLTRAALGFADANGALTVGLPKPALPVNTLARVEVVQGYVNAVGGEAFLTEPTLLLVLNRDSLPDCNGNGVFDVLDVIEGAPDIDHDFVPDTCEYLGPWYVDASAALGGNGSSASPFQTLAQAFAVALDGDTIIVRDGVYAGPANRNLDSGDRALTVISENGAANCTIDCNGQGRAFTLGRHSGGPISRAKGLHILNGHNTSYLLPGGAILATNGVDCVIEDCVFERCTAGSVGSSRGGGAIGVDNSPAVIRNCTFDQCIADFGGAIYHSQGSLRVEGCTITNSQASGCCGNGGLGGAIYSTGTLEVSRCVFDNNAAVDGGAICANSGFYHAASVAHCEFRGNRSASPGQGGGAIHASAEVVQIDDCLFAGGQAPNGGAIWVDIHTLPSSAAFVTNCTFVGNQAFNTGGALWMAGPSLFVHNSILWDNTANAGDTAAVSYGNLEFDYCDVKSTASSYSIGPAGNLLLGAVLAVDPKFVDPDGADNDPTTSLDNVYRLQPTSPCLDAGDNTWVASDFCDVDGDGNVNELVPLDLALKPRVRDALSAPDTGKGTAPFVDLGCYERQS